jgi:hypothetical protein
VPEFADRRVLRVLVDRFVTYDEILAEPGDPAATLGHIDELVASGVLQVARAGPGADRLEVGARGLVIGEQFVVPARRLRQARYVAPAGS